MNRMTSSQSPATARAQVNGETPNLDGRLAEVDSLRGIAAFMVMLFHYTTRYDQLFLHTTPPFLSFPWGYLGVNLFFMISGFVIFMTLDRTKHPFDFVISRFSRLYPVYWCAVITTFFLVIALQLPGKKVDVSTAAANFLMFHGLFGVKHVDNVYWTLEIELIFYLIMLTLWCAGLLRRPLFIAYVWLGFRGVYLLAEYGAGIDLPYVFTRFLVLKYIPYFLIGISLYLSTSGREQSTTLNFGLAFLSLVAIGAGEGVGQAVVSFFLALLFWTALRLKPQLLRSWGLIQLGILSYPLYLIHENIGWGVIFNLEKIGINSNLAIVIAVVLSVFLAFSLNKAVEIPATKKIRAFYHRKKQSSKIREAWSSPLWIGITSGSLISLLLANVALSRPVDQPHFLHGNENVGRIQRARVLSEECIHNKKNPPKVVLVLGQSNAANHGEPTDLDSQAVFFFRGKCFRTGNPVPGATGTGASPWPILANLLSDAHPSSQIIFAILAVDSAQIAAWNSPGPLNNSFLTILSELKKSQLQVVAVLWQQGEADAQLSTAAEDYMYQFRSMARQVERFFPETPIIISISSVCGKTNPDVIARTQQKLWNDPYVLPGPDLNSIGPSLRKDGCHFRNLGLERVAAYWLMSLNKVMQ
jgi:peptidoglycan/LPS O-acetylase OafA/YrhL